MDRLLVALALMPLAVLIVVVAWVVVRARRQEQE
jgi:uncharacterized membrane protein YqjE